MLRAEPLPRCEGWQTKRCSQSGLFDGRNNLGDGRNIRSWELIQLRTPVGASILRCQSFSSCCAGKQ
jgi:hypothetical protein